VNPARTLETPDERALPCGGAYALYLLTSLRELDPHQIVRSDKHWEHCYPDLGSTWCGPLSGVVLQLIFYNFHEKVSEAYGMPLSILLGQSRSPTDRAHYDRLREKQKAMVRVAQADVDRIQRMIAAFGR
jgi:hypothetical protein